MKVKVPTSKDEQEKLLLKLDKRLTTSTFISSLCLWTSLGLAAVALYEWQVMEADSWASNTLYAALAFIIINNISDYIKGQTKLKRAVYKNIIENQDLEPASDDEGDVEAVTVTVKRKRKEKSKGSEDNK